MEERFTAREATDNFKKTGIFDEPGLEEAFFNGASYVFDSETPDIKILKSKALDYAKEFYTGSNGSYCNSLVFMYQLGAKFMANSLITIQDPKAYSMQVKPEFKDLGQSNINKIDLFK